MLRAPAYSRGGSQASRWAHIADVTAAMSVLVLRVAASRVGASIRVSSVRYFTSSMYGSAQTRSQQRQVSHSVTCNVRFCTNSKSSAACERDFITVESVSVLDKLVSRSARTEGFTRGH